MGNRFEQFAEEETNRFSQFVEPEQQDTVVDYVGREIAEPFNRGVVGILDLPVHLINMGIQGLYAADKITSEALGIASDTRSGSPPQLMAPFAEAATRLGGIAPPEEQRQGLVPDISGFLGASALPFAGIMGLGYRTIANPMVSPVPTILQNMGKMTATQPGKMTAFEIASNVTAASGGKVAEQFTDDPGIIAMAQLGAAFIPSAVALVPDLIRRFTIWGKGAEQIINVLGPYSQQGAKAEAAKRLQNITADPESAAAKIDVDSPIPAALQTEDPNLIKLQDMIFKRHPAIAKKYSDELRLAIEELQKAGTFGGDPQRARHILNVRSQQAVEDAFIAVEKLGPNATPRQVSAELRRATQSALNDSLLVEKQVWGALESEVPGDIVNARKAYDDFLATVSPDEVENLVPGWLAEKLQPEQTNSRLLRSLDKDGWVGADGEISPAIKAALEAEGVEITQKRTFNDLKVIRSRVLHAIREEKGLVAPNRNRLRVLGGIQEALLDDLTATGVVGATEAREFSAALNGRYRKGLPGRLLGYDKTGAEKVAAEDIIDDVIYSKHPATNTQKLIEMASENPALVVDAIRARYIQSVYKSELTNPDRIFNLGRHRIFVENLRNKGMFEIFPELEVELHAIRTKGLEALKLDVPEAAIGSTTIMENRSAASLLLQASPRDEMAVILNSQNPEMTARSIVKRLHGNEWPTNKPDVPARQGLKTAFFQEVLSRSGVNGEQALNLLDDYAGVMRQLQFTDAEISRAYRLADEIRVAQLTAAGAGDIGTTIMEGALSRPIEIFARILGARVGGHLGKSTPGGSIQMAAIMSKEGRDRILSLTTSQAEKIIIAAYDDPKLFRALLVGPTASQATQEAAGKTIDFAVQQAVIIETTAIAINSKLIREGQE